MLPSKSDMFDGCIHPPPSQCATHDFLCQKINPATMGDVSFDGEKEHSQMRFCGTRCVRQAQPRRFVSICQRRIVEFTQHERHLHCGLLPFRQLRKIRYKLLGFWAQRSELVDDRVWLVVWTPLKNISQLGWLFPIYGKIKNVPNHQPGSLVHAQVHLGSLPSWGFRHGATARR